MAADRAGGARNKGTAVVYLVRPDGYLATRGTADRLGSIHDYLRALAPDASRARLEDDSGIGVRPDVSREGRASSEELTTVRRR
jgi:hypothetical protein